MTKFDQQDIRALSADEINELQSFLNSEVAPKDTLSLEGLDGFFCALAVAPELVLPSEWLPLVWGEEEGPAFESEAQAERILGLIMRHWNHVNRAVRVRPEQGSAFYMPFIFEPDGRPVDPGAH
jgi:uncharacterized protein